jgi:hypothetical protein
MLSSLLIPLLGSLLALLALCVTASFDPELWTSFPYVLLLSAAGGAVLVSVLLIVLYATLISSCQP